MYMETLYLNAGHYYLLGLVLTVLLMLYADGTSKLLFRFCFVNSRDPT